MLRKGNTPALLTDIDSAFAYWLMGFIDGEASFGIARQPRRGWRCWFRICLRDDDAALLMELHETLGVGTIDQRSVYNAGGRNNNPQVCWNVQSLSDCLILIDLIDRHGLRSKKAPEYAIWREAILLWSADYGTRGRDWQAIADLGIALKATRAYR